MSIIPNLSLQEISQAQSNIHYGITPLIVLLRISILGITCLLTPTAFANPVKTLSGEPTEIPTTRVTTLFESQAVRDSFANLVTSVPVNSTVVSPVSVEKSVPLQSNESDFHIGKLDHLQTTTSGELVWSDSNFFNPTDLSQQQPTFPLQTRTIEAKPTPLPRSGWEISQTTVIPAAASKPLVDSSSGSESQITASQPNRWHFLFQPYIYLPITIYGDATFDNSESRRTVTRDIVIDAEQITTAIQNELNFAFLGDWQAWTPNYHLGLFANVNYLSASNEDTLTRPVRRPGLADFISSQLQAEVDTQVWSVDLAAAYRFYNRSQVNPKGIFTEFDLGTFVFDLVGGLNIASVNADLDLSTNLGGQAEFDGSTTVVSPVLGGRLRVNASPKLAVVTAGSVSGFGIGGLTQWSVRSGLDWMFSGNTSLGLGYRFGYVSYNKDFDRDRDVGVSLNQNGPYLSFTFRF
ncbi:hypothetical protein IQ238_29545 [Pleurocapsales cyanobacterium LEGE 06147]|nr:hypothetical protein [Pleurocapsales cyanobacterium LEGE 06147]